MKTIAAKPRVTIKDVAESAGVSPATVSLILSKRPGWLEQFHPDTVKRVRDCAAKLGYSRNMFATSMLTGASTFFALVLHEMRDDREEGWHHWAFEGALLEGVNGGIEDKGVHPIVVTTPAQPVESDTAKVAAVIDGGVFGSIVRTPSADLQSLLRNRLQNGHPTVVVFPEQTAAWATNAIDLDNLQAGQTAAKLLAARRRRQCVVVRYRSMTEADRLRLQGFARTARDAGARVTALRLPDGIDEHEVAGVVARQIDPAEVDGIYAVDSVTSIGSLLGCMRAGVVPGSDCDLVGCDASMWRTPGLPTITCVDVSWREVGRLAVEKLLRISGSGQASFKSVLLKPRIVEGDSCPVSGKFRPERQQARGGSRVGV